MVKLFHAFVFLFSILIVDTSYGQGGPIPFYANTGATSCLWQQNGQDQCPTGETKLCSTICRKENPDDPDTDWSCIDVNYPFNFQILGSYYGNADARVTKWTSPPCETNVGKQATTGLSYVCRQTFECNCVFDPAELWYNCVSSLLTETILLNVSQSEIPCVIACEPPPPIGP